MTALVESTFWSPADYSFTLKGKELSLVMFANLLSQFHKQMARSLAPADFSGAVITCAHFHSSIFMQDLKKRTSQGPGVLI